MIISEKDKDKIEKWLSETENPKIKQQIDLLKINEDFLNDIDFLKIKWKNFLKQYIAPMKKIEDLCFQIIQRASIKKETPPKLKKQEEKNLKDWGEIFRKGKLFTNTKFNKDIFNLSKKYKLYPINLWQYPLTFYILTNDFEQPNIWFGIKLLEIISQKELIQLPKNMNFDVEVRKNKETREQELFIQIFESTSWRDLKKHWKVINDLQERLKKEKGIQKRYYPKKNLEIGKQLAKLDKLKYEQYYEPTLDKWIDKKITDQRKALEIYENDFFDLKEEQKIKNKIKQIRHRHKNI
jgi:hypothetical protein